MQNGNKPYSRQLEGVSNQIEWLIAWGGTIRKRVSGGGAPISRSSQRRGPITLERGHKCGREAQKHQTTPGATAESRLLCK